MSNPPNPLPQAANELQREYANHVLGLLGYIPNNSAIEPKNNTFTIHTPIVHVGEGIDISDTYDSPPLAAYIDGILMRIETEHIRKTGKEKIRLIAPEGTRGGGIVLKWPSKTLTSKNQLMIITQTMELLEFTGKIGDRLLLGAFPENPTKVDLGGQEVPLKDISWHKGILFVTIPKGTSNGPIFVITPTDVWKGDNDLVILP